MIKNDWQLRVTIRRIRDFEDALFELKELPIAPEKPWLRGAQEESLQSELERLRKQVEEYELLKSGKVNLPGPEVIQQVPELLIKTRISKGLNQEDLARRLGVTKQCIQQYEQSNYAHVTISVAQKIMQTLMEVREGQPDYGSDREPESRLDNSTKPKKRAKTRQPAVERESSSDKSVSPQRSTKRRQDDSQACELPATQDAN